MSESVHTNTSLWSKGMKAVIVAQFLSAFGDNALLFATLALLKAQFYPEWSQPILQMVFVGAYILFAPFVGQVADSFAKGRVMMFANGLKLLGAASICFGINPFLGYTLVGVGAAAYSPAKYGILGELTTGSKLVKANGLMEASTIAAILLGSVAGGVLCLIGGVLLLKRRLFSPRVRATTTGADILILSLLVIQCALGLLTIPFSAQHMDGSEMMKLVGWAQSVVTFHGGASQHLDGVAFIFRLHLVLGMTLFLLFPFSRLVHIWSVPVEYLTRKYQLVRARH